MDFVIILQKINCYQYSICVQYLVDIDLIISNVFKYNFDRDLMDKFIRYRVCEFSDVVYLEIKL